MSEKVNVCKALGAMFRNHGDPNEAEVTFVPNAAMELGLTQEETEEVTGVLKDGGEFAGFVKEIKSRPVRAFFFRRLVAATLLDEKVEDDELKVIHDTADEFGFDTGAVDEYLAWMKEGIEWEKRGADIMAKL